jgi:uncharacterized membrane protein YidH (DUF202 family)
MVTDSTQLILQKEFPVCLQNLIKLNPTLLSQLKYMLSKTTGIVLIVLGLIMIIYTGFNYVATEKVIDFGPVQVNKKVNHPVQWSPIVGGILLIGGIVIIASARKKST